MKLLRRVLLCAVVACDLKNSKVHAYLLIIALSWITRKERLIHSFERLRAVWFGGAAWFSSEKNLYTNSSSYLL